MKYIFLIIRTVFAFSLVLFLATTYYDGQLVPLGVDISDSSFADPIVTPITDNYGINFEKGDYSYKVKPIADYLISGIVLNKFDATLFNTGPDNGIQYDFCMAWGDNLKGNLYLSDKPSYTQFKRSCYFNFSRDNGFDADKFSNNRLIINTDKLLDSIRSVNVGDEITLKGRLANITAYKKTDLYNPVLEWKTRNHQIEAEDSMSEIIYVDSVSVTNPAHYKESIINYYSYWVMLGSFSLMVLHVLALMIFMHPQKRRDP